MNQEKDNDNNKKPQKDDAKKKHEILTRGITFITCEVHKIQYPKGSTCPKCKDGN